AEDGIRDLIVTGVQTCALPILALKNGGQNQEAAKLADLASRMMRLDQNEPGLQPAVLTLRDVRAALNELHGRDKSGEMNRTLRQMDPFALDRESHHPVPFLLIEDPQLSDDESRKDSGRVDRH